MEFVLKQIFFCLCFSIIKGFILLKAKLGASVDACFFFFFSILKCIKRFYSLSAIHAVLCLLPGGEWTGWPPRSARATGKQVVIQWLIISLSVQIPDVPAIMYVCVSVCHRVHQVPQDELAHKELMAQGYSHTSSLYFGSVCLQLKDDFLMRLKLITTLKNIYFSLSAWI